MRLTLTILFTVLALAGMSQLSGSGGQYEIWTKKSATDSQHALLHLPSDYNSTPSTKRYPLMVFFPGIVEGVGTDLAEIYTNSTAGGPAYEIAQGHNMTFTNPSTGLTEKFIVVSVQSTELNGTTSAQVPYILADLFAKYPKIDTGRITLTCISQGGHPTSEYAGGTIGTPAYRIAAYIPMSATLTAGWSQAQANFLYARGTDIWGFGDASGGDTHGSNTGTLVYLYNLNQAGAGRFTNMPGAGHGGWNTKYDTDTRETFGGYTVNIYEWALMQGTPTVVPSGCGGVRRNIVKQSWGAYFNGSQLTYNPGDTLVVRLNDNWTGTGLSLENIYGTASCPVVIINEGGVINMNAISLKHCRYIKLTGSGAADPYGFYFTHPTGSGVAVNIEGRSKNIEVEKTQVYKKAYMVWCKTEADCADSLTYPNWYMDSISYHHNKGFNIGQDALYFGSTSPNGGRSVVCGGSTIHPIPLRLSNIKIYNNIIDSSNRTAIQLSGADQGSNEIYNNTITRAGFELNQTQGAGIISGGVTKVYIHDNYIRQTFQSGITIWGAGLNRVENNDIDSSGYLGAVYNSFGQPSAILVNTYVTTPSQVNTTFVIKNNEVGRVATADGKQIVVSKSVNSYNTDNVVCGNVTQTGTSADVYVEPTITYTTAGCTPPTENVLPIANAGTDSTITLPISSIQLSGSATDSDGTISSRAWAKVSGGAYSIDNAGINNPVLTNLQAGVYVFRLTVTDNSGGSDTDDVTITVLPSDIETIKVRRIKKIETVE